MYAKRSKLFAALPLFGLLRYVGVDTDGEEDGDRDTEGMEIGGGIGIK